MERVLRKGFEWNSHWFRIEKTWYKARKWLFGETEVGFTLRCLRAHTAEQDGLDSDSRSATG